MSVFEVGKTISENTGGHASAGGSSGAGNRFYFSDDTHAELGIQRGNSYDVRIRLKGNTSGYIKMTMIGHRGYAPNAMGNSPFCYIVEALPQQMGTRAGFTSAVQNVTTRSFEEGIEAQHLMGLDAGEFYPTVSCFQYTDYTEITLRVMNLSTSADSADNNSVKISSGGSAHSGANAGQYAGQEDVTVEGQAAEFGGDAIFFAAYIDGHSYNSSLSEGIFTSYNRIYGGRGIVAGGEPDLNIMEYVAIGVKGNSVDFGDLTVARQIPNGLSNGSRGIFGGGTTTSAVVNTIDYITIANTGNATDFGDIGGTTNQHACLSNDTRAVFAGGKENGSTTDTMAYITIASTGNTSDFGNLLADRRLPSGCASTTRGIIAAGIGSGIDGVIQYITIGSTGNALDFGDLTDNRYSASATATRGGA